MLPRTVTSLSRCINRVVRLGDSSSLSLNLEIPLIVSIIDSNKCNHRHNLWYSVLNVLSHDTIISLFNLIGTNYDLLEDSIWTSRQLATSNHLGHNLPNITTDILALSTDSVPTTLLRTAFSLGRQQASYRERKRLICASPATTIDLLALQDGSSAEILYHPRHGSIYRDNQIKIRYDLLSSFVQHLVTSFSRGPSQSMI